MGKKRVLVVDDNEAVARAVAKVLALHFEVDVYFNSESAFKAALATAYDCVVSDVDMPGMNGPQLRDRLVAERPDMSGRFVFHTGSYDVDVSPCPVLRKPASSERLVATVEAILKAHW